MHARACGALTVTDSINHANPYWVNKIMITGDAITRRNLLIGSGLAAMGLMTASPTSAAKSSAAKSSQIEDGTRNVAFVVSRNATVIDFAGPWEVFSDVYLLDEKEKRHYPFRNYLVAETMEPIKASFGLTLVPDYTFVDAPTPSILVVPAQSGQTPAMIDWIKKTYEKADITASICTGAFVLAATGLLDGKRATTHHQFLDNFAKQHPSIEVVRGVRFVEEGRLMTAGGLTSGLDTALRIVDRLYGRDVAMQTAVFMEYEGRGWIE